MTFPPRALRRLAATAPLAAALLALTPRADAVLIDGAYALNGMFDSGTISLTGTFDVLGGTVLNLTVSTDYFFSGSAAAIYIGTGVAESLGTLFSGELTLTNPSGLVSGTGFLHFGSDGRFACGGLNISIFVNTCQVEVAAFGTNANEKVGSYTVTLVEPAAVPLPATLPLTLSGIVLLAAAGAGRRHRPSC